MAPSTTKGPEKPKKPPKKPDKSKKPKKKKKKTKKKGKGTKRLKKAAKKAGNAAKLLVAKVSFVKIMPEDGIGEAAAERKRLKRAKSSKMKRAMEAWWERHAKAAIAASILKTAFEAFMYYFDVASDVLVTLDLSATNNPVWTFLMVTFLVLPTLVTSRGILKYRRQVSGRDVPWWEPYVFFPLYLAAPVLLDCSMLFIAIIKLNQCPLPNAFTAFLVSYAAMRTFTEAVLESLPQLILQAWIWGRCTGRVGAAVAECGAPDTAAGEACCPPQEEMGLLVFSLSLSLVEVLYQVLTIVWVSRVLGVPVKEYVATLIKIGGGLPIDAIKENDITELKVRFSLDEAQVKQLAGALRANTSLERGVDLSRTRFTVAGAKALAHALCSNTALKKITLSTYKAYSSDKEKFELDLFALRGDTKKRSLDMSNRGLTFVDGVVIAELLKANKTMTKLVLRNNKLGDNGAAALAMMLCVNKTLEKLNLENNKIEHRGGQAMVEALRANSKLNYLNLLSNRVETTVRKQLQEVAKAKKGGGVDVKA